MKERVVLWMGKGRGSDSSA